MIVDVMAHKDLYGNVHPGFKAAFDFIEKAIKEELPVGKYEIQGKEIYAMVQEYDSAAKDKWECHRKYIDIQMMLSGTEVIRWENIAKLPEGVEYLEEKDCSVFAMKGGTDVVMEGGMYCILFPQDLHSPGNMLGTTPSAVRKIVVKIAV